MFRNVLVAIDGSATAHRALRQALSLMAGTEARVTALCVIDMSSYDTLADMQGASQVLYERHLAAMQREAHAIVGKAVREGEQAGVPVQGLERVQRVGRVADAIVAEAAQGYDLLVIGTHGRRGVQRLLLGSDAEQVLRTAPIPVLLVRGE